MQKNDSSSWPEDVRKAYDNLKIPSIYDCVLANEKLSVEIHNQNRQIKDLSEKIQDLSSKLHSALEILKEVEVEEYDEEDEDFVGEEHSRMPSHLINFPHEFSDLEKDLLSEKEKAYFQENIDVLLETIDTLVNLSKNTKKVTKQVLSILPKKEGLFNQEPSWYKLVEELTHSLEVDVDAARYQIVNKLNDLAIEIIDPQPGETFLEEKHKVIDKVSGGKSGTIARVVRIGYELPDEVLRPAEVILYT